MKIPHGNLLLGLGIVLLVTLPFFLIAAGQPDVEMFVGVDDRAEKLIAEIRPDYEPWAEPLWAPPSGEVESLLFSVQAALGAGFIGYYFGRKRGASR